MQQLEQMSRTLQRTLTDDDDGNDKQLEQPNEHWNTIGSTQRHNNWLNYRVQWQRHKGTEDKHSAEKPNATTIGSTTNSQVAISQNESQTPKQKEDITEQLVNTKQQSKAEELVECQH